MTSPVRAPRPTPRATARRIDDATTPESTAPHLRVVGSAPRRTDRKRGRGAPADRRRHVAGVVVVSMVVVFGSLLASAVLHGMLAGGQTKLDRIDAELRQERASLAREQLTLSDQRSLEHIALAATDLGMVPAATQHWVSAATGDQTMVAREPATGRDGSDPGSDGETNELAIAAGGTEAP